MAIVLVILWLALRSPRIIIAVFATVAIGLAITAAVGLMLVSALNLISVAFAVLFVGIGVDFGIQFSVRYRAERHQERDLRKALANAGEHIASPLALAAAATAAGFLSFVPTAYKGVSELGQIAGLGMIIAFLGSVTVLPALLAIFNPPGESEPLGYAALAPVDRFMERYRWPILIGTSVLIVAALPSLYFLKFDFNPIDLRNPKAESIATYLDVRSDPAVGANAVDVLTPSQAAAQKTALRLSRLPEVRRTVTLASFVPGEQADKIALIDNAAKELDPALDAPKRPTPSDAENVRALKNAQAALDRAARSHAGPGPKAARRLAADLGRLAAAGPAMRERAQAVFITPLETALKGLASALHPQPVSEKTLPPALRRQWVAPGGQARVQVMPRGIPLIVAGVVTLELCVGLGLALNFANIIALPLLLGIGVAFKIYYMMSWRAGYSQVLQSPLTRAVFFSALTTATAFGSLWFSNHPGTSSMGKLLALSLVCTLAAAVLYQPVLMGPPRRRPDAGADGAGWQDGG
ncbi:MAG: MMPL family transporter, partial [Pseudolabrys sp.]